MDRQSEGICDIQAKWKCHWIGCKKTKTLQGWIEMPDGTGTRQSHPFLIKNGKSQGTLNTPGCLKLQHIKTLFHTAGKAMFFCQVSVTTVERGNLCCCNARILRYKQALLVPYKAILHLTSKSLPHKRRFYQYKMRLDSALAWPI